MYTQKGKNKSTAFFLWLSSVDCTFTISLQQRINVTRLWKSRRTHHSLVWVYMPKDWKLDREEMCAHPCSQTCTAGFLLIWAIQVVKCIGTETRGGRVGRWRFMGTECQFCMMKKFWISRILLCTTILILTLLNCILKNDKDDTVYVMCFLLSLF